MLEATCITKAYGSRLANDCLTTSIQQGEVVGLLGENGAGKSTLLSILAGRIQPDSGQLSIDGATVAFESPRDALRAGISIVFQHFSLVPSFTIREQLRLAGWASSELPEILASRFQGNEFISQISLGERQLVEVARALVFRPRFLLLDEPTSILTSAETAGLFATMRDLSAQGTSVVFVTHKLHEAMTLCDRIVVLRQGRVVDNVARTGPGWPEGCERRLLEAMFGRDTPGDSGSATETANAPDAKSCRSPVLFHAEQVTTGGGRGSRALDRVCVDIRAGEVCAIVGVDGQGQRELAEVCSGYAKAAGSIHLGGRVLPLGDARAFQDAGVTCLTEDRMGEGSIPGFSVEDTMILKRQRDWPFSQFGGLRKGAIREYARNEIARWHIEPANAAESIDVLSGGNVQKVLLARELSIATSLLIVNQPSQGLDARTRDLVWDAIRRFVGGGAGVLLLTTDIDEALEHGDRVAVMYEGRLSSLLSTRTPRDRLERVMVAGWT